MKAETESQIVDIEIDGKLFHIERFKADKAGDVWLINGTMTDIEFYSGLIIPAQAPEFVRVFRARISRVVQHNKDGITIFSRKAYAYQEDKEKVKEVISQLPDKTYILSSVKTMQAYKSNRILVPERDTNRKARTDFEISGVFYM